MAASTVSEPERTKAGIPDSELPGPYSVGEYARALRDRLRAFAHVQLVGELVNLRQSRARVYFELRDDAGAIPCAVWLNDWEAILARIGHGAEIPGAGEALAPQGIPGAAEIHRTEHGAAEEISIEGMQVVVAGGCDFYPGSATSSPGFSFSVTDLRIAGEGDLLARIERLRKQLDTEGLLDLQKLLHRPQLPRTIGVITGENGKARDDILAGLHRRGWLGRIVWGFAPVQDRHAAPLIVQALTDLAGTGEAEVVVVARGGGSLVDLLCFCDETLCRTVAMLNVPVIASVGHHTDRTLLDDVAAVSCSTPTHAAEAAVRLDCDRARGEMIASAARLREHGRRAVLSRAQALAGLARAPAAHVERQRTQLHQRLREIRAASRRRMQGEREFTGRHALVLQRKTASAARDCRTRRAQDLRRLALALAGHDPQRALERGYALVQTRDGEPIDTADGAIEAHKVRLRFADGTVAAKVAKP